MKRRNWLIVALLALSVVGVYAQRGDDFADDFLNTDAGRAFIQNLRSLEV